jgi:hypothetical protein
VPIAPYFAACCPTPRLAWLSVPGSGGEGDRTPDLVNAIHALSQLSYAPVAGPGVGFRQELLSLTGYNW